MDNPFFLPTPPFLQALLFSFSLIPFNIRTLAWSTDFVPYTTRPLCHKQAPHSISIPCCPWTAADLWWRYSHNDVGSESQDLDPAMMKEWWHKSNVTGAPRWWCFHAPVPHCSGDLYNVLFPSLRIPLPCCTMVWKWKFKEQMGMKTDGDHFCFEKMLLNFIMWQA